MITLKGPIPGSPHGLGHVSPHHELRNPNESTSQYTSPCVINLKSRFHIALGKPDTYSPITVWGVGLADVAANGGHVSINKDATEVAKWTAPTIKVHVIEQNTFEVK
jgi:ABC-type taurine transport system substrate-binding protein